MPVVHVLLCAKQEWHHSYSVCFLLQIVQSKDEPFVSGLKASAEGIAALSESVGLKLQRFVSAQEMAKAAFGAQALSNTCLPTISFMAGAELCKA